MQKINIMAQDNELFKKLVSHCKEYGFIFPSSEIYDGLSAVYDYGQYGVELKNNIKQYWWRSMVQFHENIVGIDAAILMHPKVWKASGHVDAFNDPLIDNKDSKIRYKADQLVEDYIEKLYEKAEKEVEKAKKRFGDNFDEKLFRDTNEKVKKYTDEAKEITDKLVKLLEENNLAGLKQLIEELKIVCPVSGTSNWTEVRQFNLMFSTQLGSTAEDTMTIYLRPETAQGIYVNYLNILKTSRQKVPFGIAQIGKAFRNEIVARQFIFRMREFEQMEMQYFVKPGTEKEWFEYWKEQRMQWHLSLGIPKEKYRWHEHEKLAHYANAAVDIEYDFPFGFKELEGIHSRTDYDLKRHQEFSGKKMLYFDPDIQDSYIPYVVETSVGLDRTILAVLSYGYTEETLSDGSTRVVLKIPDFLAPIKVAILPLVKKDGMNDYALNIFNDLKKYYLCQYDEKDSIGRRYRRQDAIGTPYCITVDGQTLEDNTVTIRERDSMLQDRIPVDNIRKYLHDKLNVI